MINRTKRNYPARRVVELSECRELRRYAQSTFGQSVSQRTLPADSRSIATANDSEQEREPLATLVKCPSVVPQRSAKDRRSGTVIDFKRTLRVMRGSHHTVSFFATPIGEFTRCGGQNDNSGMEKPQIRRANLRRFVVAKLDGNNSRLSRLLGNESTAYVNDLLRDGSTKSFGEKVAAKIEEKIGLQAGQLDIKDSPLLMDEKRRDKLDEELKEQIAGLTKSEKQEIADVLREIYIRRKKTRRA